MACLDPEATDRAADMARTDNADCQLGTWGGLTRCGRRLKYRLEDERACGDKQCAAIAINSDMLEHQHTIANCSKSCPALQEDHNAKRIVDSRPELVLAQS